MAGFPEIGLKVRLDLKDWTRPAGMLARDTQKIDKIFQNLSKGVDKSTDNIAENLSRFGDTARNLPKDLEEMAKVFGELRKIWLDMGKPEIDVGMFDRLVDEGYDISTAFRAAAGDTDVLSDNIDFLRVTVSRTALGIAAASAILTTFFAVVNKGVQDFQELGNEVRILQYQFGGTAAEMSAWIRIAERAGVPVSSLESTVGMLQRSLIDMELRLAEGKDTSTQFTRAIKTLDIDLYDMQGNLRPTSDLLEEIAVKISNLGPGQGATGLSEAIFGRGGRRIIPLLHEIAGGLDDARQETLELGTAMSEQDRVMADLQRRAGVDLKAAFKGLSVLIGRYFTPIVIAATEALTKLLINTREWLTGGAAQILANLEAMMIGQDKAFAKSRLDYWYDVISGKGDEAANAAEKTKVALDEMGNAAIINERKLEALTDQMKEVERQLDDLADEFADRRADLVLEFGEPGTLGGRRWDDILIQRMRELEDAQIARFRRDRDMWISYNQRLEDIYRRHGRRQQEIEEDQQDKIEEFRRDAQRRREQLEIDHQRRLRDIQLDYLDTVQEAARKNDAVAVVQAMRERARAQRDEQNRYKDEQEDLQKNLDEKLQQIKEQAEKQRQELQDNLQEQLDDLEINYQRQLQAQQRALQDQREDRQREWRRQEEDFNRTKQRQYDDLQRWYDKEKQLLVDHLRELAIRANTELQAGIVGFIKTVNNGIMTIYAGAVETTKQAAQQLFPQYGGNQPGPGRPSGYYSPTDWYQRQSGGLDIVSGPTNFTFGEGGNAEAILSVPLRGQVTHSHQFSPLSIGFEGVPAGTDTKQMESMMFRLMTKLFNQAGIG
jgi:hypothetical protein